MRFIIKYCPICGSHNIKSKYDLDDKLFLTTYLPFYCEDCTFGFNCDRDKEIEELAKEKLNEQND